MNSHLILVVLQVLLVYRYDWTRMVTIGQGLTELPITGENWIIGSKVMTIFVIVD